MHSIVRPRSQHQEGSTWDHHHSTPVAVVYRIFQDNTSWSKNFGIVLYFPLPSQKVRLPMFFMYPTKVDQNYSYKSSIPLVIPTTRYTLARPPYAIIQVPTTAAHHLRGIQRIRTRHRRLSWLIYSVNCTKFLMLNLQLPATTVYWFTTW